MVDTRTPFEVLRDMHALEITIAFQALQDRWRGIFTREDARWSQAGKEWKLAKEQDGHLSWKPYAKPFEAIRQDYREALTAMQAKIDAMQEGLAPRQGETQTQQRGLHH